MTDSETDQTDEEMEEEVEKEVLVEEEVDEKVDEEVDEENEEGDEHEVEQDEGNNTKRNTNKRSWVWEHFKFEDSAKKARCNYCKSLISCNKGSTTGLSNHLKSKHSLTKDQGRGQLTIREVINNSKAIVSDHL